MDFVRMTACEIAAGVKAKDFSALEVANAHIARIEKYDSRINACVTRCFERAVEKARGIDSRVAAGETDGNLPLAGVPVLLKDNFCTRDVRTTCGSRMLENWVPTYDASVVESFENAGAIVLGKANMDEFAMGSTTESSIFGPTLNPRDESRVPGGSSGGSAAGVAAGYCPVSLGSDTGGSIRLPAAFCGVHGMKPSYGEVSRYGIVGYVSSLDQVGPFARNVKDLSLALDVLARPDPHDSTCDAYVRPRFSDALAVDNFKGRKIGILSGYDESSVDPRILEKIKLAAQICRDAGAEVVDVEVPLTMDYGVACYYILALGDASSKLACFDGMRYGLHVEGQTLFDMYSKTRDRGFGFEVKRRILLGTCVLTSGFYDRYYRQAERVRNRIYVEFEELFRKIDALLMPVSPSLAYPIGMVESDPQRIYLGDAFTVPMNLAGLPSISLNMGGNGLPVNIQIVGGRYGDQRLLSVANIVERATEPCTIASFEGGR